MASKNKQEKHALDTIHDVVLDWVLKKYEEGKDYWDPHINKWKSIKKSYRNIYQSQGSETSLAANINIPMLKKIVRNKVSHYQSVLLSKGAESFDLKPGPDDDYIDVQITKAKIKYDLEKVGVEGKLEPWLKSYELLGYGVGYVPWEKNENGEGPNIHIVDITKFVSDPYCNDLSSWKIFVEDYVPVSYLRQKEKDDIYTDIKKLDGLKYPVLETNPNINLKDKVQILEYHGLVPKSLLTGKLTDMADINPFEDDYVWGIITVAQQKVVIRAREYPYDCGNIFFAAWKDKMIGENTGIGIGEDTIALIPMVTNLYNKLTDIVNFIANNMYEIVLKNYEGDPNAVVVRPGKFFFVKQPGTVLPINTTAQASALRPLFEIISMFEKIIEELTATPPQVMPNAERKDIHETLGGLMQMTEQAMRPINAEIQNNLEPAYRKIIELFYKHNIQFFKEADAEEILGREKAEIFDMLGKKITKEHIKLEGNPDIIPTGVSGFIQDQIEQQALMTFLEIGMKAAAPKMQPDGMTPMMNMNGEPMMEPVMDIREICKRIGERFHFDDLDKLIPSLKVENKVRALEEKQKIAGMRKKKPATQPNAAGETPISGGAGSDASNTQTPLPSLPES